MYSSFFTSPSQRETGGSKRMDDVRKYNSVEVLIVNGRVMPLRNRECRMMCMKCSVRSIWFSWLSKICSTELTIYCRHDGFLPLIKTMADRWVFFRSLTPLWPSNSRQVNHIWVMFGGHQPMEACKDLKLRCFKNYAEQEKCPCFHEHMSKLWPFDLTMFKRTKVMFDGYQTLEVSHFKASAPHRNDQEIDNFPQFDPNMTPLWPWKLTINYVCDVSEDHQIYFFNFFFFLPKLDPIVTLKGM